MAGYHLDGYNVLFSDFHAKRVRDPDRRITKAFVYSHINATYQGIDHKDFQVWEYFSRNP